MHQVRKKAYLLWWLSGFLILVLCTAVIIMVLYAKQTNYLLVLEKNKSTVTEEIVQLEAAIQTKKKRIEQKEHYLHCIEKFTRYASAEHQHFFETLLKDLAFAIPYDLYVSSLEFGHKIVTLKGYASAAQSVLQFLDKLRALPYIYEGKIIQLKAHEQQENSMLEFIIRLDVNKHKEGAYVKNKKIIGS